MGRPRKPATQKHIVMGTSLRPDRAELVDYYVEQLGVTRARILRAAVETLLDANPIDEAALVAWREERASGRSRPSLRSPNAVLALVESTEERGGGENGILRHVRDSDLIVRPIFSRKAA